MDIRLPQIISSGRRKAKHKLAALRVEDSNAMAWVYAVDGNLGLNMAIRTFWPIFSRIYMGQ